MSMLEGPPRFAPAKAVVLNLARDTTLVDVVAHFAEYGDVVAANIKHRSRQNVFAFVEFSCEAALGRALAAAPHVVRGADVRVMRAFKVLPTPPAHTPHAQPTPTPATSPVAASPWEPDLAMWRGPAFEAVAAVWARPGGA